MSSNPLLSAVVIHWRDEEHLTHLLGGWPRDPRWELIVVDNSHAEEDHPGLDLDITGDPSVRILTPDHNLGFAGGANAGIAASSAPWVLILNPDAFPHPRALEALCTAMDTHPDADGLVPALEGDDGAPQCQWQLQPLPSATTLLLQTLFLAGARGPQDEPSPGTPIEQPAAAALALRRTALDAIGGFDESFYPAWFEDVDLARRLARTGHRLLYVPSARFTHAMGGSVPSLGYGPFLWVYYRNLCLYLALHHGSLWPRIARITIALGMALRLALLPLRKPQRAASRSEAARGLWAVLTGALGGFRRPRAWREHFRPRPSEGLHG